MKEKILCWSICPVNFSFRHQRNCSSWLENDASLRVAISINGPTWLWWSYLDCAIFLALGEEDDIPIFNCAFKILIGLVVFPIGEKDHLHIYLTHWKPPPKKHGQQSRGLEPSYRQFTLEQNLINVFNYILPFLSHLSLCLGYHGNSQCGNAKHPEV